MIEIFRNILRKAPASADLPFLTLLGTYMLFLGATLGFLTREEHAFRTMTAAQHMSAAKEAMARKDYGEGLRHVSAVATNLPESAEAKNLEHELTIAEHELTIAKMQKGEEEKGKREAAQIEEQTRESGVRELQARLRDLGYDLKVSRSDTPDEILIVSEDFKKTDDRVKFLSFVRGGNSSRGLLCRLPNNAASE